MVCLIGSVSGSGVHAHRWGSERATQSQSCTRSGTGGHSISSDLSGFGNHG